MYKVLLSGGTCCHEAYIWGVVVSSCCLTLLTAKLSLTFFNMWNCCVSVGYYTTHDSGWFGRSKKGYQSSMFQDLQLKWDVNICLRNSVLQSLSRDVVQNFIFLEIACITGHAEAGYLTPQNFSPLGFRRAGSVSTASCDNCFLL